MKTRSVVAAVLSAAALTLSIAAVADSPVASKPSARLDPSEQVKVWRGFQIAPVPLNLAGKNYALVGLGSYIVNAQAGCNDCHTWPNYAPGGDPYHGEPKVVNTANYMAGGRPFGPFRSRNITPDPASTLTDRGALRGVRCAHAHRHRPRQRTSGVRALLQVMPWSVYQDMTTRDLRAIFEYLQAIPHAEPFCQGAALSAPPCTP